VISDGDEGERVLADVRDAFDALIAASEPYDGLIPSVLDRETGTIPDEPPPSIPGQRDTDRSFGGCNLLDDRYLLWTMDALGARGQDRFRRAADRYVETFVARCTDTATGLFPWGDHAFWDLEAGRVGDSYSLSDSDREPNPVHDQRSQAPYPLWQRLAAVDPDCVRRFADGLDFHWNDDDRTVYDRHAWIERRERHEWGPDDRACDFPRHSGYFVVDLAAACALVGEDAHRSQLRRFADYWWPRRDDRGLLPYESRGDTAGSPEQTLSLSCCLLDAAAVLSDADGDDALAGVLTERARTYLGGVAAAAHAGSPLWASGYPNAVRAAKGLAYLSAWRHTGMPWLRERAVAVGEAYRRVDLPDGRPVRAADPGLALALLVDLHGVTGEDAWLRRALSLADAVREHYLDGAPLPRRALGVDGYEAQLGSGLLLYGLARTGLAAVGDSSLDPDATALPAGWHRTETHHWGPGWG
jgi:hypothetical protein